MPMHDAQRRLTVAEMRKRRAALGPALDQSDDDLTRLARTGPERLAEITAFVRETAGDVGVALLNAEGE